MALIDPSVSVIIPAYNAAPWIRSSIRSALCQSHSDLEIVVVDDGSTDATADIVEAINDPRVRLVRQSNQGQSSAINAGVARSRGAFVKLLDADDWLNPGHVSAQLQALKQRDDCVASCQWGYFVVEPRSTTGRLEFTHRNYDDPLEFLVDLLTRDEGMMGGWRWLIPRPVWDRAGGFNEQLNLNNDFEFSIRLLLSGAGVRHAPGALYGYRKRLNGTLSVGDDRRAMESAFLTTKLGTDLLLAREDTPRVRRICADRFQQWLFRFYPEYPDLAEQADLRVAELGGSCITLQGGRVLQMALPLLGWRHVRRLQTLARHTPWRRVTALKARRKLKKLKLGESMQRSQSHP